MSVRVGEAPVARAHSHAALALLSLSAGFLHAAVIHAHEGHGIASQVFTWTAIFQVAWAGLLLARPSRGLVTLGAVASAAFVVGWVLSRTSGIAFIDGFQEVEPVGFTDGLCAALEGLLVAGAALLLLRPAWAENGAARSQASTAGLGVMGLVVAGLAVPAAAAGAEHDHGAESHSHGTEVAAGHIHDSGSAARHSGAVHVHEDPSTATPQQRAAADRLMQHTKDRLWQWTDEKRVYDAGFRSIGDAGTGNEHFINWAWINDDTLLDPDHPESLVYRPLPNGRRVLEAAMYIAPERTPDDEVPDIGGPITQWHHHKNLCFSPPRIVDGAVRRVVIGVTETRSCTKGDLDPQGPMLHVWVVKHRCGPFAALDGIGAGQAISEAQDPNAPVDCQHSNHD